MKMEKKLNLDNIVLIGRSFNEYMKIFDLDLDYLKDKKILDCPAGAGMTAHTFFHQKGLLIPFILFCNFHNLICALHEFIGYFRYFHICAACQIFNNFIDK